MSTHFHVRARPLSGPDAGSLVASAARLRWRAPELALLMADQASTTAARLGHESVRLRAEVLAVFACNQLGRGTAAGGRALRAFVAARAAGEESTERLIRVELAACAADASAPAVGLSVLRPALERANPSASTARAAAFVTAADCVARLGGGPEVAALLRAADELYDTSRSVEPDAVLLRRGIVHARLAAYHRRLGDHESAGAAARAGLALVEELGDGELDTGQVSGALIAELVLAQLDGGRVAEAVLAAQPVLRRAARPAGAATSCWLRLVLVSRVHLPAGRHLLARRLLAEAAADAERNQLDAILTEVRQLQAQVYETCAEVGEALLSVRAAHIAERRWRDTAAELRTLLAAEFGRPAPAAELRAELAAVLAGFRVTELAGRAGRTARLPRSRHSAPTPLPIAGVASAITAAPVAAVDAGHRAGPGHAAHLAEPPPAADQDAASAGEPAPATSPPETSGPGPAGEPARPEPTAEPEPAVEPRAVAASDATFGADATFASDAPLTAGVGDPPGATPPAGGDDRTELTAEHTRAHGTPPSVGTVAATGGGPVAQHTEDAAAAPDAALSTRSPADTAGLNGEPWRADHTDGTAGTGTDDDDDELRADSLIVSAALIGRTAAPGAEPDPVPAEPASAVEGTGRSTNGAVSTTETVESRAERTLPTYDAAVSAIERTGPAEQPGPAGHATTTAEPSAESTQAGSDQVAEPARSPAGAGSDREAGRHRSDVAMADLLAEALLAYQNGRRYRMSATADASDGGSEAGQQPPSEPPTTPAEPATDELWPVGQAPGMNEPWPAEPRPADHRSWPPEPRPADTGSAAADQEPLAQLVEEPPAPVRPKVRWIDLPRELVWREPGRGLPSA